MPAIVKFPAVVEEAMSRLGNLFPNEPERRHLAEHLTDLIVAHKKNVSAINREFAMTTDQSCLNRWLTASHWDEQALNQAPLAWLQKSTGLLLLDRYGVFPSGRQASFGYGRL